MPVSWGIAYLFVKFFILNFFLVYLIILPFIFFILRKTDSENIKEKILMFSVTVFFIKSVFYTITGNVNWGLLEYLFLPTMEACVFTVFYLLYFGKSSINKYLKAVFPFIQLSLGISASILLIYRLFVFSWIVLILSIFSTVITFLFLLKKQPKK